MEDDPLEDAGSLLMDISAALPSLATLQWEEESPVYADGTPYSDWQCSPASVASEAAESPAGAGLRLLHAEKCSFEAVSELPASLQRLSICNRLSHHTFLHERLDLLLAPCAALRELSIVLTYKIAPLDLPAIAAACPELRVLVLHYVIISPWKGSPEVVSPSCAPACMDEALVVADLAITEINP